MQLTQRLRVGKLSTTSSVYKQAQKLAFDNGHDVPMAAILWHRGRLVSIGINNTCSHSKFFAYYSTAHSPLSIVNHAEMAVLDHVKASRKYVLEVIRWKRSPPFEYTMAKPCINCLNRIRRFASSLSVRYTGWDGKWHQLTL